MTATLAEAREQKAQAAQHIAHVDQRRMGTELHHVVDDNKTLTAALDTLKIDYDDLKFRHEAKCEKYAALEFELNALKAQIKMVRDYEVYGE